MPDNVIDFRQAFLDKKTKTVEEAMKEVTETDDFIARFSVEAAIDIVEVASSHGFDITSDARSITDVMMLIEAVASFMARTQGHDSPFHDITDGVFKYDDEKCEELLEDFLTNSGVFT